MQLHKILTVVNIYGKDYTLVMRSFMHGQMCGLRVLSHSADSVLIQHRMDYVDWPILIPDMCGRVVDQQFRGEHTGPQARGVVDQRLGRPAFNALSHGTRIAWASYTFDGEQSSTWRKPTRLTEMVRVELAK